MGRNGGNRSEQAARFWRVDLHVHTPASNDVAQETYGAATAADLVEAAIGAGLDAIGVTDHNTVEWCDAVSAAADDRQLIVLPGVEISTANGHLLALFDEGTKSQELRDLLVRLGFDTAAHGDLDRSADKDMLDCANLVVETGGIAIAAHADREKGLLGLAVKDQIERTLRSGFLSAVEIVSPEARVSVDQKSGRRTIATIQNSDSHTVESLGRRSTWIKAGRPDLAGIRHAFDDRELRTAIAEPPEAGHPRFTQIRVDTGFFAGAKIDLAPDLTCLLGGTGSGKSLLLELIRFVVDQQASERDFPAVRTEVESRLAAALGIDGTVELDLVDETGSLTTLRRRYTGSESPAPEVVRGAPAKFPIAAFSQGEVIEFARQPTGRVELIDAALDLRLCLDDLSEAQKAITAAADRYDKAIEARETAGRELQKLADVRERHRKATELLGSEIAEQDALWVAESTAFLNLQELVTQHRQVPGPGEFECEDENGETAPLREQARRVIAEHAARISRANGYLAAAFERTNSSLAQLRDEWRTLRAEHDERIRVTLGDQAASVEVLRSTARSLGSEKATLEKLAESVASKLDPEVEEAKTAVRLACDASQDAQVALSAARRSRVSYLNDRMRGEVKIRLRPQADGKAFGELLGKVAVGARLRRPSLDQVTLEAIPSRLIKSFLKDETAGPASAIGLDESTVSRLFEFVRRDGSISDFIRLAAVQRLDQLEVSYRKPGSSGYTPIESLAHGQKCTAILIIALADGIAPLIIDQPEDALHAPWIEEHIVARLRDLRGTRQFLFATRSPGVVVSADADLLITMGGDNERGEIEASGALDRFDLNKQALYHLEGGRQPFQRRVAKLKPSIDERPGR